MNDRKVKGKPHIEAWQWARIERCINDMLSHKIYNTFFDGEKTLQGHSFWSKILDKIEARGR